MDEASVKYMMTSDLSPTIANIYKAEHSSSGMNVESFVSDFDELVPQIEKIVDEASIDAKKGLEMARWLLANDIPLDATNGWAMDYWTKDAKGMFVFK